MINDIFLGDVSEFLKEDSLILTEDIKSIIASVWNKLTDVEKEILLKISQENKLISRDEIRECLSMSSMDIINGLQSLTRRFLLIKLEGEQNLFHLSSVFREYLRVCYCHPSSS